MVARRLLPAIAVMAAVAMWSEGALAETGRPVRFGVLMGLNHTTRHGDLADMDWVNGIAGGLALRVRQLNRTWVEFELLYSRKGSAWTLDGWDSELRLTYLEMPVLLGLPLRVSERMFFEPRIGLAPARKIDEELEVNGSTFSSHYFQDWDVGAILGVAVRRETERVGLSFEVRYTIGLRDIDDPEETEFRGTDRNKSVSFLAGVLF